MATAIVDYGMGNLRSVEKACAFLGDKPVITGDPALVGEAERIILPGVGAFEDAAAQLRSTGLDKCLIEAVHKGTPLLGICLGMQLLFEASRENGKHKGLGLLPGEITRLSGDVKIPQIGWNQVDVRDETLFANVPDGCNVYFVHSYAALDVDAPHVAGVTTYGVPFACAVRKGNLFGTQFHPEKSGHVGLQILKNFLTYRGESPC